MPSGKGWTQQIELAWAKNKLITSPLGDSFLQSATAGTISAFNCPNLKCPFGSQRIAFTNYGTRQTKKSARCGHSDLFACFLCAPFETSNFHVIPCPAFGHLSRQKGHKIRAPIVPNWSVGSGVWFAQLLNGAFRFGWLINNELLDCWNPSNWHLCCGNVVSAKNAVAIRKNGKPQLIEGLLDTRKSFVNWKEDRQDLLQ